MSEYAQAEKTMPSAPGAIEQFRDAATYLHDRLDLLTHRLEPVLSNEYPSEVSSDRDDPQADILKLVREVHRAAGRVDNLLSRLVV